MWREPSDAGTAALDAADAALCVRELGCLLVAHLTEDDQARSVHAGARGAVALAVTALQDGARALHAAAHGCAAKALGNLPASYEDNANVDAAFQAGVPSKRRWARCGATRRMCPWMQHACGGALPWSA